MESPDTSGIKRDKNGRIVEGSVSLNPEGRPVGSVSIIGKIRKIFEEDPEHFKEYVGNILKDPKLRHAVMEQLDGKPKQAIDLGGELNLPFTINIIKDDGKEGDNS